MMLRSACCAIQPLPHIFHISSWLSLLLVFHASFLTTSSHRASLSRYHSRWASVSPEMDGVR
ncbi:hypothetical protein E2C01_043513 [Portunus trituberculatus]|uniref:Uncharacterized protein n=1 Tax=Portunus trituberculatus TaxID=210409 RepID=A0A5B7FQH5_PORTR|nr:hypothetical protein [Portunus trituberculatus]